MSVYTVLEKCQRITNDDYETYAKSKVSNLF